MIYKHGVDLSGLDASIWWALGYIERLYEDRGYKLVVTSGREGVHSVKSLHYKGFAVDLRTHDMSVIDREIVLAKGKLKFFPLGYDFVYESTPGEEHFHLEYDPKPTRDTWQIKQV